ncbi:MAG: polysaccharide deacetylase family protein, partial [Thermohalobaculum sp.]|nr:polysaccharide deacetylase family protein [Thermohalobaculum sp.]
MIDLDYPRDLAGYRGEPPDPRWPGNARVAVQFALDIEEGGENCVLHGDAASESLLSELIGAEPRAGARHMAVESIYEYGSRAGVWRVLDLFRARDVPITLFAVAAAAVHTPWVIDRAQRDGHEIACHGLRWVDYAGVPEEVERTHIAVAAKILDRLCG